MESFFARLHTIGVIQHVDDKVSWRVEKSVKFLVKLLHSLNTQGVSFNF